MKIPYKFSLILAAIVIPLMFIACGEQVDEEAVAKEIDAAENDLRLTVNNIEGEISNLETKLDTVETEASAEVRSKIEDLEELKQKAENKLDELAQVSAEEWDKFKTDLESFKNDLESDFNDLIDKGEKLESEM